MFGYNLNMIANLSYMQGIPQKIVPILQIEKFNWKRNDIEFVPSIRRKICFLYVVPESN